MSAITNFARQLADADKTFTSAVAIVAEGIARAFGADPTFDEWEAGAAEFKKAYAEARGCQESTAVNRWSFVCKELKDQYGLEKPRKPSAEAEKKAAQREGKAAQVDAVLKEHRTMEDLTRAMHKADKANAKVYADALIKKAAEVEKQAKADAKARAKTVRESIRKTINDLDGQALDLVDTVASGVTWLDAKQLESIRRHVQRLVDEASSADEASTEAQEAPQTAMAQALASAGLVEV